MADFLKQETIFPTLFGPTFLEDHAGRIMRDPQIAIVELVANAFDAGATKVEIKWPTTVNSIMNSTVAIEDNGIGMSREQFQECWAQIKYDRRAKYGEQVNWPADVPSEFRRRKAYGRNGKGRHAMFCFSDTYQVVTCTEKGESNHFEVSREIFGGENPYSFREGSGIVKSSHGTKIWATFQHQENYMAIETLRDLIGSKFAADPAFLIFVNDQPVELEQLSLRDDPQIIEVPGLGELVVHLLDSGSTGRLSKQHGVAWWVKRRLVGETSWRGYDFAWLDARASEAKRYTFIVQADILESEIESDWSGFKNSNLYDKAFDAVKSYILRRIDDLLQGARKEKKQKAIANNVVELSKISKVSRAEVGRFISELIVKCPSLEMKELSAVVELLAKLEQSRTAYSLLQRLVKLKPDELDILDNILDEWTVRDAQLVLDILRDRLILINELEKRSENPATDELHELQPLFEKGLWIFGPEYESIDFTSNRQLATVVRDLLKMKKVLLQTPKRRPDFVALPDASIGVYARDGFDIHSDISMIAKIFILELKAGDKPLTRNEKRQGSDYAAEIRQSGKAAKDTEISVLVLGKKVDTSAQGEDMEDDRKTIIRAKSYTQVLREAKARTMFLTDKIKKLHEEEIEKVADSDVEQIVGSGLFRDNGNILEFDRLVNVT